MAAISRLHMDGAGLAYLSACSTSDTSPRLTDEALHITAAFQLAGYRNVIGTLWPVADRSARIAAEAVYAGLTSQGATTPDTSRAAEALHQVVRAMRARYARWPAQWAAHIHMGGDPVPPGAADDTSA